MFLLGTRKESEVLISLDVTSGKERWATPIGSILNNGWGNGPRSTPTVDGNMVYAMGGRGNLLCANAQSGQIIWQASMTDFGGRVPGWGYTESVLVDENQVLGEEQPADIPMVPAVDRDAREPSVGDHGSFGVREDSVVSSLVSSLASLV